MVPRKKSKSSVTVVFLGQYFNEFRQQQKKRKRGSDSFAIIIPKSLNLRGYHIICLLNSDNIPWDFSYWILQKEMSGKAHFKFSF